MSENFTTEAQRKSQHEGRANVKNFTTKGTKERAARRTLRSFFDIPPGQNHQTINADSSPPLTAGDSE
jgi:hypothetical protein